MFHPRTYQEQAVNAFFAFLHAKQGNPLVVAPTGAGKSWIQAMIVDLASRSWEGIRIVLVSHVKELLQQNAEKINILNPRLDLGFLSAGIGQKNFKNQILVCGIQTAYKHAARIGHVDLVLVDESHLIPNKSDAMYQQFLNDLKAINPYMITGGLTATPYRMNSGMLYGKPDSFFDGVCYDIPVSMLIEQGHLSRVTGRRGITHVDLSKVHTRGGEFITSELQEAFDQDPLNRAIIKEVIPAAEHSKGILIFSSGVSHAKHLAELIRIATNERVEVISGDTNKTERETIINDYKAKKFRWLINYGVLTTGFDAPHIDLLVLCRATKSTGLYVQIIGRGMRIDEGKDKCVVLDYGGNIERHGPIDKIKPRDPKKSNKEGESPIKECPECLALLHLSIMVCPECEYEFPPREPDLDQTASHASIMSDEVDILEVDGVTYHEHMKRSNRSVSMRVDYNCGTMIVSEWVCFEHFGRARQKAEKWARVRGIPTPATVEEALDTEWPDVGQIKVNLSGKYPELLDVCFITKEQREAKRVNQIKQGIEEEYESMEPWEAVPVEDDGSWI
jgi:DNA repair protein RadD